MWLRPQNRTGRELAVLPAVCYNSDHLEYVMPRTLSCTPKYLRLFLLPLFLVILSAAILLAACTGNGGSANSNGEVYIPGGSSGWGNSGTTSSGGSPSESFTAEDLLNLSNAGNTGRIIQLISQAASEEDRETTTIVMSAADLGLPADGTVTLTITGAVSFTGTVGADADGNVTFIVPKGESGKTVTVELVVKAADGRVICSGSETQTITGDIYTINIQLVGEVEPLVPPFEVMLEIGIPASTPVADGSGGSVNVHYLSATQLPTATDAQGSALFTFSATPVADSEGTVGSFAASGNSYDWTVNGVSLGAAFNDSTVDLHLPDLGITDIASMPAVRTNYTIGCRISRADTGENVEKTYALTLEPKLHTVNFMKDNTTVAATLQVLDGSSVWDGTKADGSSRWTSGAASPPVLTWTNRVFNGWYANWAMTTPFRLGDAITADTTVYAGWQNVDAEKRNPSPPDFLDEDGSGHSYLFDMNDFTYSAGAWSSAIKLKNSVTGSTTTVYMDIRGTNKSIGYNHGGIKFFGNETPGSTDGGTINVIFSTSTTGTLELGFKSGTHGNIECVSNVTGNISVDPNCTVSEMKIGSTEYTNWNTFITAARANTSAYTNASFRITRN